MVELVWLMLLLNKPIPKVEPDMQTQNLTASFALNITFAKKVQEEEIKSLVLMEVDAHQAQEYLLLVIQVLSAISLLVRL